MRNLTSDDRLEVSAKLRSMGLGRTALLKRWGFVVQIYPVRGLDRTQARTQATVYAYKDGRITVCSRDGLRHVYRTLQFNLG